MILSLKSWGQIGIYYINLDDSLYINHIIIDTVNYPNNKWQIGKPQKVVFDSAYSYPNAIVTDTSNPLPAKDTSVFYLRHLRLASWQKVYFYELGFWHKMNGDSSDFGKIEIMPDTEGIWVDILDEDSTYDIYWHSTKPNLNGSTNGWKYVHATMTPWSIFSQGSPYPVKWNADTILIRFTYITDSGSAPHDGWMIDQFDIWDWIEGINDVPNQSIISIMPNPVEDMLHIKRKITAAKNEEIEVMNMMGEVVIKDRNFVGEEVDVSQLPSGVYLLHYNCDQGASNMKFTVER